LRVGKNSQHIAVLDIGTSKILCLVAKLNQDGVPTILGHGHQLAKGIGNNGVISDIKSLEESIISAVSKAERAANISIENVTINFSGNKLQSRFEKIDVDIANGEITGKDVSYINDIAFESFSNQESEVIQSIAINYSIDGISGISNPRFMCGNRLTAHLNLVTLSSSALRNLFSCLSRCHLNVTAILPSAYASALSCLTDDEKQNGTTIIDIGEGNISIAIFLEGQMHYTNSFPFAGRLLTKDIQQIFSLTKPVAERVKSLYGSVFYEEVNSRDTIDLFDIIKATDVNEAYYIQKHKLCEVIYHRSKEILSYINEFLNKDKLASKFYKKAFSNIVLTGGSSNIIGIAELARNIFGVNVKIMKPKLFQNAPAQHDDPKFSTAYGLALYALSDNKVKINSRAVKQYSYISFINYVKKITGYNNASNFLRKYF
jgi:cell division protein FtsA